MKQGQTLCWCVWCGTELVAGGYCYCLDIGCLCPACLPEYARVVFRSCLVAGGCDWRSYQPGIARRRGCWTSRSAVCAACGAVRPMRRRARCWPTACASCARPDGSAGSLRSCANTIMKGDSIVMHPILSKASLREPDTERLNTMLRVALTPLQYETVVAVYLHGHPQKEVAIDRGVSPASVCQLLQRAERRVGRYLGYL